MLRLILGMLGAALAGAAVMYAVMSEPAVTPPPEIVRDIVTVEKMSEADAEVHRQDRYASLQTIEQVYALPTEFGRAEALYAMAGRGSSGEVQNLVFEANRIADEQDRAGALNILFFRLTEMDPQSALALSRMDGFRGDRELERRVWISWGRRDLDAALAAAAAQETKTWKNVAAQALYTAFGGMGNDTTDRIEEELGVGPDRNTRGRFIYRLADESPARAIAYINSMEPGTKQEEFVSWLAFHLAARDPEVAATYSVLFENSLYKDNYERIVARNAATADPKIIMDQLVAGRRAGLSRFEIFGAIRGIARGDLQVAMSYHDGLRSREEKDFLMNAIAEQISRRDVDEALAWARANDTGGMPKLEMQVLQQLAQRDLARAIAETRGMSNASLRDSTLASVIQAAAQRNPEEAIRHMHLIENPNLRDDAAQQAMITWFSRSPEGAVDWLLTQDRKTAAEYLASPMLFARTDVDAAIRLLPLVADGNQQMWRYQIAESIASSKSASAAMSFVAQFEGEDGHDNLQQAVINGVAQTDVYAARQLADQLPPGYARDNSYAQLIQMYASTDPQAALGWLSLIDEDMPRGRAAMGIVGQWYQTDPGGAQQWVRALPDGVVRDDAIMGLAQHWQDIGHEEERLIASVSSDEKRSQMQLRQIYSLIRRNPAKAREMLETADLTSQDRLRIEQMLNQMY